MNKSKIYLILLLIFGCTLSIPFSSAESDIDYKTNLKFTVSVLNKNTSYNIEKAKLLQTYVEGLLEEIFKMKREYAINNNDIDSYIFDLKRMSQSLTDIQTHSIEKQSAETVIKSITDSLEKSKQEIGITLKSELQKSKKELSQLKKAKSLKAKIISKRMIQFVNIFRPKVEKITNEKKRASILLSLDAIAGAAHRLGSFENRLFHSQAKMNEYYSNSVKEIRRELEIIKATIRIK